METPNTPSDIKVIDVDLPKRPGVSLAADFISFVHDHFSMKGVEGRVFDARSVHFRVHGNASPYMDVVDFQRLLPELNAHPDVYKVELIVAPHKPRTDEELDRDTIRVLRSFEGRSPEVKWTNEQGSVLVSECVVDLIRQYHQRLFGV